MDEILLTLVDAEHLRHLARVPRHGGGMARGHGIAHGQRLQHGVQQPDLEGRQLTGALTELLATLVHIDDRCGSGTGR